MRIGLHADGGLGVGLGHLGRCAALAHAFRKLGGEPVLLDLAPQCRPWARAQGLAWTDASASHWDLVVGDSYRLTASGWARLRRRGRRLLVIDDFGTFSRPCDWVLNGHVYASRPLPRAPLGASLLLGPAFLPLRKEYWKPARPRRASGRIKRVLVTMGGGAGAPAAAQAAAIAAKALPHAEIQAITGPFAASAGRTGARVIWHRELPSLRAALETSDVVICNGGQTMYEAAFAGTPALAARLARNQEGNLRGLAAAGCAIALGGPSLPRFAKMLTAALRRLDRSPALRRSMGAAGQALIDGRGALRVARTIMAGAP